MKAFTLAEVLITLGVIGVVAGMTMPALIQNHQKQLTVTKLKHFSSVMQQASKMREKDTIDGNFQPLENEDVQGLNGEDMEKYINVYVKPYLKVADIKVLNKGAMVILANGSGAYFQRTGTRGCSGVGCNMFITYCPDYKYCEKVDEKENVFKAFDTRHVFAFYTVGNVPNVSSRENALSGCTKDYAYTCSSLIRYDGWKIEKDYPW